MQVVTLWHTHDLRVFDRSSAVRDGWFTHAQAARRLDVCHTLNRALISGGLLRVEQVIETAPVGIRTTDITTPVVQD